MHILTAFFVTAMAIVVLVLFVQSGIGQSYSGCIGSATSNKGDDYIVIGKWHNGACYP